MSIEPNEAEKKLANVITDYIMQTEFSDGTANAKDIAAILAAHRAADDGELAKALEAVVTALDDIPALTIHGSADLFQAYHAAKKLLHAGKGA